MRLEIRRWKLEICYCQKMHLYINFYEVEISVVLENGISLENAKKMPFPVVIFNFLEKVFKIITKFD